MAERGAIGALAYVFWHRPAPGVDEASYAARMRAFHAALDRRGSVTFAIRRTPWDDGFPAYEDWYPVAGWADLGRLNAEAVDRARRGAHDAAAHLAAWGAGGVYARIRGASGWRDASVATWLAKPAGATYAGFLAGLPEGSAVWQRQLVLGPAPEFAIFAADPTDLPAGTTPVGLRRVAP